MRPREKTFDELRIKKKDIFNLECSEYKKAFIEKRDGGKKSHSTFEYFVNLTKQKLFFCTEKA